MKKLTIYRGLPGSGKSTLASSHEFDLATDDFPGLYRDGKIVLDLLKAAHQWHIASTKFWLKSGASDVAIHNTFVKIEYMYPYFELALKYGYKVVVIDCKNDYGSIHNVPEDVMKSMAVRWEDFNLSNLPEEYKILFDYTLTT